MLRAALTELKVAPAMGDFSKDSLERVSGYLLEINQYRWSFRFCAQLESAVRSLSRFLHCIEATRLEAPLRMEVWKSFLTAKTFADRLNDFIEQYELTQLSQNLQLRYSGTDVVEISSLLQKLAHQLSYSHRYTKEFAEEFVAEYSGFEYMLGTLSILQRWLFEMSMQHNSRFTSMFHRNTSLKYRSAGIILAFFNYVDTFGIVYKSLTALAGQNRDDSRLTIIVAQLKYGIKHSNFQLQTLTMRFLNKLFSQAPNLYYKIIIQAEAETAGFSTFELEKMFPTHFWKGKKDRQQEPRRWSVAFPENVECGSEMGGIKSEACNGNRSGLIDRNPFYEDLRDSTQFAETNEDVASRYEVYSPKKGSHFLKHRASSSTDSKASDFMLSARSPREERIFENFPDKQPSPLPAPQASTRPSAVKQDTLLPAAKLQAAREALHRVGTTCDNAHYRWKTANSNVPQWKSLQDLKYAEYEPRPNVYFGDETTNGSDSFKSFKGSSGGGTSATSDRRPYGKDISNDSRNDANEIAYHPAVRSHHWILPFRRAKTPTAFEEKASAVFYRSSKPIAQIIGTQSASGSSYDQSPLANDEMPSTSSMPGFSDDYRRTVIQIPLRSSNEALSSTGRQKVAFVCPKNERNRNMVKFKPSLKQIQDASAAAAGFTSKPVRKTVSYYGDEIEDALKRFDYLNDYSIDDVQRKTKFSIS
ncbi:unnamed protein product [Soboliphyme baturini]|uniref:Spindle pole body component n=1 Tax=Soboliphyme baturini TaxID=241478 RepID=A0A183IBX5_9BILA|nr:unnamed protein product [Soboliphyme baturini]